MDEVKLLCVRFRQAIINCPKNLLPVSFELFPLGACGDASLVPAKFLQDNGYDGFDYVLGCRKEQSHAWLERDGWIVLITASQFDESLPDVIVTIRSDFHKHFIDDRRNKADLAHYDAYSRGELNYACSRICQYLNE